MRGALVTAILIGLLLSLAASCGPAVTPIFSPDMLAMVSLPNLIVHLEGEVQVKRAEWIAYQPATFGMELWRGDLIRTGAQGEVAIFCYDISVQTIAHDYEGPVPCRLPHLPSPTPSLAPLRAGEFIGIPYVISPRKTKIMTPNPLLKWNPIAEATKYTVIVRGGGREWRTETTVTEMVYPPEAPSLIPREDYKLEVIEQGSGRSSEEEKMPPGFGFSLLLPSEIQELKVLETRINSLPLDEVSIRFILVSVYARKELRAAAIAEMESLAGETRQPTIYRSLGDLYLDVRLYRHAVERYSQAAELSRQLADKEGQALAQVGLGLAYFGYGNDLEALKHLREAVMLYEGIGDSRKAETQTLIESIEKK